MPGPVPALIHLDRPHRQKPTLTIKATLVRVGRDARHYAHSGPKRFEDALHRVADELLDELQARGELG